MTLSRVSFAKGVDEDFMEWKRVDGKVFKKIQQLIEDIQRSPYSGIGQPEPLKYNLTGWYSRRITKEHRLVYRCQGDVLEILSCRGHYSGL